MEQSNSQSTDDLGSALVGMIDPSVSPTSVRLGTVDQMLADGWIAVSIKGKEEDGHHLRVRAAGPCFEPGNTVVLALVGPSEWIAVSRLAATG